MKKILLSLWVLAFTFSTLTAQINRAMVLVEIGTGTGCGYCPGAAMGLHDLYTNGDPVAGIEYHSYNSSDPFNTPEAAVRTSYYGVSGYPTAQFDGEYDEKSGGSASSSLYSSYLPKVTARMAMQTNFAVEILGDNIGTAYDIIVRVEKFGTYAGTNLKVRFALTETDIPYSWQGQSLIEYCERLMAPDAEGTAISFTSGNVQDVNLTFTFDNTWIPANCELIAWIQDESDKFVLHSASVMLPNLIPDVATSHFTSDISQVCENNSVQFNDLSTGAITGWNWTFEGGTPATSTEQNPLVTYANQGWYDVTLEVTDGPTTSTLTTPDMIEAIVEPVQPVQPVGDGELCNGETEVYTTQAVPYTDTYTWEVSPAEAGVLTPNDIEATFVADNDYVGAYTISVRADNSCGTGTWSTALNGIMSYTPNTYQLSGGGGICPGSAGNEVILDGSETGVDYEMFIDDVTTGTILAGTGNPLNFGYQNQEGTYTVIGFTVTCDEQMFGTPWIYYLDTPVQPQPPAGSTMACNDTLSNYVVSNVDYADTIYWDLTPVDAGIIIGGDFEADIQWSEDFSGNALLTAQGVNDCGVGEISDATEIIVENTPNPEVSGLDLVCHDAAADYSVEDITGNTYEWTVTGGEITNGAGTSTITVMWGNTGSGMVQVDEATPNNCSGISSEFNVVIDECIGINENEANSMSIYPNPATSHVDIVFNQINSKDYKITVYNTVGQLMTEINGVAFGNQQKVNLNISNYQAGLYIVNIVSENGLNIRSTFEKTK